jgi:hypothetical protein
VSLQSSSHILVRDNGTPKGTGGSLSIQKLLQQIVLQWNPKRNRRQSFHPKAAATNRLATNRLAMEPEKYRRQSIHTKAAATNRLAMESRKVPAAIYPYKSCCNKSCCSPQKVSRHRIPTGASFSATMEPRTVQATVIPTKSYCDKSYCCPHRVSCHCNPTGASFSPKMETPKVTGGSLPLTHCEIKSLFRQEL